MTREPKQQHALQNRCPLKWRQSPHEGKEAAPLGRSNHLTMGTKLSLSTDDLRRASAETTTRTVAGHDDLRCQRGTQPLPLLSFPQGLEGSASRVLPRPRRLQLPSTRVTAGRLPGGFLALHSGSPHPTPQILAERRVRPLTARRWRQQRHRAGTPSAPWGPGGSLSGVRRQLPRRGHAERGGSAETVSRAPSWHRKPPDPGKRL